MFFYILQILKHILPKSNYVYIKDATSMYLITLIIVQLHVSMVIGQMISVTIVMSYNLNKYWFVQF